MSKLSMAHETFKTEIAKQRKQLVDGDDVNPQDLKAVADALIKAAFEHAGVSK